MLMVEISIRSCHIMFSGKTIFCASNNIEYSRLFWNSKEAWPHVRCSSWFG